MSKIYFTGLLLISIYSHLIIAEVKHTEQTNPAACSAKACIKRGGDNSPCSNLLPDPTEEYSFKNRKTPKNIDPYRYDSVTVLVYRINLADKKIQQTQSEMEAVNESINRMYNEWSGNRFRTIFKFHPEIWEAPKDSAGYSADFHGFVAYFEDKISGTGVDPDNPGPTTRIMVFSRSFGYNSSGGPPLMKIYDNYEEWVIMHELHHTLGIRHSNGLECETEIITGDEDYENENMEYGDVYCNMGIGYERDMNCAYKNYFGWLSTEELKPVTYTSTHRIYAHDQETREGTPLALTIPSGNGKYTYWLEYRPGDEKTRECVLVHVTGYLNNNPDHPSYNPIYWDTIVYLLDMKPNSVPVNWWGDDMFDAGLAIGETFSDPFGGCTIKTLQVNQGVWDANGWVEVEVDIPNTPVIADAGKPEKISLHTIRSKYRTNRDYYITAFNVAGERVSVSDLFNNTVAGGLYIVRIKNNKSGEIIIHKNVSLP